MPDQYTSRNRLTKQEIGSNEATWGNILNDGVISPVIVTGKQIGRAHV